MSSAIRSVIISAALGLMFGAAPQVLAQAAVGGNAIRLDLPAQSLAKSLRAVATAANTNVLFDTAEISARTAPALKGSVTVEEALSRLLAGSGLKFRYLDDKTIVLAAADKGAAISGAPADQMRVAEGGAQGRDVMTAADAAEAGGDRKNLVTVEGKREKSPAITGANADLPRTENDAQPYYIFDQQQIQRSGAVNLEDFLKQRLTMNAVALTNQQDSNSSGSTNWRGNISTVNLRGLGDDKTLILVNGRRPAGVTINDNAYQPDLNGIPLGAIDRIEVLPSSSSGIYGGSAVGGVVNIILRKDYSGGEATLTYDNTWDSDASRRTLSANYGLSLEQGRSHVALGGSWSDARELLLQDRRHILEHSIRTIQANRPAFFNSSSSPWLGVLPNIQPASSAIQRLVLKDGRSLTARTTHVPAGISPGTPSGQLYDSLLLNAGTFNMELPETAQAPTGLRQAFGVTPETGSLFLNVRRRMTAGLELFADFTLARNRSTSAYGERSSWLVPANVPTNPFTALVRISVPDAAVKPVSTESVSGGGTVGLLANLPGDWTAAVEYTRSINRFRSDIPGFDLGAWNAALQDGSLNLFVDTLRHPLPVEDYRTDSAYRGSTRQDTVALRGAGSPFTLPPGPLRLAGTIEYRVAKTPLRRDYREFPLTMSNSHTITWFARSASTASGYLETSIPLVRKDTLRFARELELQVAARAERYVVDTGTHRYTEYPYDPARNYYEEPTRGGAPYFDEASYTSRNATVALKYQPLPGLMLRASVATAFLPPQPGQLLANAQVDSYTSFVVDPKHPEFGMDLGDGTLYNEVETLSGGNPDLKPQHSRSVNAGAVWTPLSGRLEGLRLGIEYYRIEQFDAITSLDAQLMVMQEDDFPGRVTRDPTGAITQVDVSLMNLYRRYTEGWDLTADYQFHTAAGAFSIQSAASIIDQLQDQYALTRPAFDAVGFPSEGGAARYKWNASLAWEKGGWMLGWSTRYFGSYSQFGAAGGPYSAQYADGRQYTTQYIAPQGSDTLPAQMYHDLVVAHTCGAGGRMPALFDGLRIQIGVRNVFDRAPPLDVFYASNYYRSPYGDMRLRSYWASFRRTF